MSLLLDKLREPFPAEDIEWRIDRCGESGGKKWIMVIPYVTNRAIQQRLDDVCGTGWRNTFLTAPNADGEGGCICRIEILIDGEWIGREDGAPNTDRFAIKGGLSDSMKRCAVQWGCGRYLYRLDGPHFADVIANGKHFSFLEFGGRKEKIRWNPPLLPPWALPGKHKGEAAAGTTDALAGSPPTGQPGCPAASPQTKKRRSFPRSPDGWMKKAGEDFGSAGTAKELLVAIDFFGSNFDKIRSEELYHQMFDLADLDRFPDDIERLTYAIDAYRAYHPTDEQMHEDLETFTGPQF